MFQATVIEVQPNAKPQIALEAISIY